MSVIDKQARRCLRDWAEYQQTANSTDVGLCIWRLLDDGVGDHGLPIRFPLQVKAEFAQQLIKEICDWIDAECDEPPLSSRLN